jgi:hypothetical protein
MNKTLFNWEDSIHKKVFFVYSTIQGYLTILGWELNKKDKNCTLKVEYNDNIYYINSLYFKKCGLSKIFNFKPFEFKYNIGVSIINEKKDIVVTDRKREYIEKRKSYRSLYKYTCNVCGFKCGEHYKNGEYQKEYWADEASFINSGCLCCTKQIVVQGINDIATTDPWMIPIVGNEIAQKYSHGSTKSIFPICPNCGKNKSKKLTLGKIYSRSGFSCSCSDKVPFGEKFMSNFLYNMNVDFISEYSKINEEWCDKYRYDFFFKLNGEKYIVETHGMQHYQDSTGWNSNTKTLEEEQENDRLKKELALSNGIKEENYIVIDTRYDSLEWIRNSMLSSQLNKLFNLITVDWNCIMSQSIKSLVVEIVKYVSSNPNYKKIDLVKKFNTGYITINSYLNQAKECELL